jgi:uncharacterized protein
VSKASIERVKAAYEAWNRGDLDAAFDFLHPDAEVSVPPNLPEAGTYRGRDEMWRWVTDQLLPILEGVRAEPQEFFDAGDRVVVFVRYSGRGTSSGVEVTGVGVDAHVWTLRGEKASRLEMYAGTEPALRAVGLSPQ